MLNDLSILSATLGNTLFAHKRALRYLRYFQQEEYDGPRFVAWWKKWSAFDKRGSAVALLTAGLCFYCGSETPCSVLMSFAGGAALTAIGFAEDDPRTTGKIKLNMTERAIRILQVATICYLLPLLVLASLASLTAHAVSPGYFWLVQVLFLQALPFFLLLANFLLSPFEKTLQARFLHEAKQLIRNENHFVIGITGSYGKTSVKSLLGQILEGALGPTFWPEKSINTPMGITRVIRTLLKPFHRYAVIEMGAYNRGSIQRLCELAPPKAAIVTAVGIMHLERFGSEENIFLAKSELAQAVPADGILVCNGDNPGARRMAAEHPKKTTLLYGMDSSSGKLDCWISTHKSTLQGTTFTLHWRGKEYQGTTKLLGTPALSNILAAFTMACALGADPVYTLALISNIEPVDNRLALAKEGDVYYLRDAYNSNPTGFRAALDVLKELPAQRRILMTPGMIELGPRQAAENEDVASYAGKICDLTLVVGDTNRQSILQGLNSSGVAKDKILVCESRSAAFQTLAQVQQAGDLVLIENDLSDLYESIPQF